MNWVEAKSYYIAYQSIDRFLSIFFIHNYLVTWSIALICSLILPLLFIFAPSSLQTTRTSHMLIISLICLSYMFSLYIQAYMISTKGEPNLSYYSCRFIIYISTFAKPMGLYLTLLFSIERLFTKVLSKFLVRAKIYRQLFQRLYLIVIFLSVISIFSIRFYQTSRLIPRNQTNVQQSSDDDIDTTGDITDKTANSTDRAIAFLYCYRPINIDTYAKILSFYVVQYWYEATAFGLIILILSVIIIHRCYFLRERRLSINTKLYISLSSCVIGSESLLLFFHEIVHDENNNNTDLELRGLQLLLLTFNFRCIILPLVICMVVCEPLKQLLCELLIVRSYTDNIDENDTTDLMNNQLESVSSPQRTNDRSQGKFRGMFSKKPSKNKDSLDNDELQSDF